MTKQGVCQYEKYGYCKEKNSCDNFHPTSVCNDDKCDVKSCNSRHPMPCRFYNHGICKYQESCKYSHKKIADVTSLKSKFRVCTFITSKFLKLYLFHTMPQSKDDKCNGRPIFAEMESMLHYQ